MLTVGAFVLGLVLATWWPRRHTLRVLDGRRGIVMASVRATRAQVLYLSPRAELQWVDDERDEDE